MVVISGASVGREDVVDGVDVSVLGVEHLVAIGELDGVLGGTRRTQYVLDKVEYRVEIELRRRRRVLRYPFRRACRRCNASLATATVWLLWCRVVCERIVAWRLVVVVLHVGIVADVVVIAWRFGRLWLKHRRVERGHTTNIVLSRSGRDR